MKAGDLLDPKDHLIVYNKEGLKSFRGNDFFTDPVAKEARKENPDGTEFKEDK